MTIEFVKPFPSKPIKNGTIVVLATPELGDGAQQYSSAPYMTNINPSGYFNELFNRFDDIYYYLPRGA